MQAGLSALKTPYPSCLVIFSFIFVCAGASMQVLFFMAIIEFILDYALLGTQH